MHITIYLYLASRFVKAVGLVYAIVISAFFIIDLLEIIKRTGSRSINTLSIFSYSAVKIPFIMQETFVFTIFIAAIYVFLQLSKKNEYTVLKSSGLSIWQFMAPFFITTGILSIIVLTIINPISSMLMVKQKSIKHKLFSDNPKSTSAIFESGFWMSNNNEDEKFIIHSKSIELLPNEERLNDVSITYTNNDFYLKKILKSQYALLKDNYWELHNTTEYIPKEVSKKHDIFMVPTNTTRAELQSNFEDPHRISVWELPYFIKTLKSTGHSAKIYIIYFYKLLVKPFIALSLICIAASFNLQPFRGIKLGRSITACGLLGFVIYTLAELIYVVGTGHGLSPFVTSIIFMSGIATIGVLSLKYSQV